MVDGEGTSIHLDGALHRLDPLPLRTHLAQRGSLGDHIDEPGHALALGWALFGLPLLLAGYALVARLFGWRRADVANGLAVFAGLYLVTGMWALLGVLPLLS